MISFNIFLSQLASLFVDPCSLVPDPVTSAVKEVRSGGVVQKSRFCKGHSLGWERGLNGVHLETPCLVQNLTIGANCDTWEQNEV